MVAWLVARFTILTPPSACLPALLRLALASTSFFNGATAQTTKRLSSVIWDRAARGVDLRVGLQAAHDEPWLSPILRRERVGEPRRRATASSPDRLPES
jgi:hypothetical protein